MSALKRITDSSETSRQIRKVPIPEFAEVSHITHVNAFTRNLNSRSQSRSLRSWCGKPPFYVPGGMKIQITSFSPVSYCPRHTCIRLSFESRVGKSLLRMALPCFEVTTM